MKVCSSSQKRGFFRSLPPYLSLSHTNTFSILLSDPFHISLLWQGTRAEYRCPLFPLTGRLPTNDRLPAHRPTSAPNQSGHISFRVAEIGTATVEPGGFAMLSYQLNREQERESNKLTINNQQTSPRIKPKHNKLFHKSPHLAF